MTRICDECKRPFDPTGTGQSTCIACMIKPHRNILMGIPGAITPLEKEPVMEEERKGPGRPPKKLLIEDTDAGIMNVSHETLPPATPTEALDKLGDDDSFRLQAEKLLRMVGARRMHIDFGRFNVTIELTAKDE